MYYLQYSPISDQWLALTSVHACLNRIKYVAHLHRRDARRFGTLCFIIKGSWTYDWWFCRSRDLGGVCLEDFTSCYWGQRGWLSETTGGGRIIRIAICKRRCVLVGLEIKKVHRNISWKILVICWGEMLKTHHRGHWSDIAKYEI